MRCEGCDLAEIPYMLQSLALPGQTGHAMWTFRQNKLLTEPQALASAHVNQRHVVVPCRVRNDTHADPLRPSTCRAVAKSSVRSTPAGILSILV